MIGKTMARRSARSRKQQTQLTFTPLPSSSPSKNKYSAAVQDRLANVRYGDSSTAKSTGSARHSLALPTPEPSSQPTFDIHDEDEDDEDDVVPPSSKRRRTSGDDPVSTPLRRSGRLSSPLSLKPAGAVAPSRATDRSGRTELSTPSREQDYEQSDLGSPESTDEEGDVMISQPARRRKSALVQSSHQDSPPRNKQGRGYVDDFLVDDDEIEYISSEEEEMRPKKRRPSYTSRRRSADEQEELQADLEDLQDSGVEDSARKSRTRGGPVTKERDRAKEHFELLKRRRAGERIPRIHDSSDENEEVEGADIQLIGTADIDPTDNDSAHSSIDTEPEPEDEAEDDFIEDDDAGRLGRPNPGIPLQFTHLAKARPKEVFPHVVEWLVKNKIAPAFARNDDVYKLAFNKVNDQVQGQAGSRLISAAWISTFKWTILARPNISIGMVSSFDDEELERHCDACNKRNHPARYDFSFSGSAYVNDTLDPVDSSDDEDEYDDDVSRDAKGHELARQTRHFYLGSHCAANAQMGHKLSHWKYHLNESILSYLEEQGVLSAEAIVARDKLKNKRREREAEVIVDTMQETGKIDELWKEFQDDLNDARLGMEDFEKKGGRSKGRIGVIQSTFGGRVHEWRDQKYKESRAMSDSD